MGAIVFCVVLPIVLVGFVYLDRWQDRRARRRATEDARRFMDEQFPGWEGGRNADPR